MGKNTLAGLGEPSHGSGAQNSLRVDRCPCVLAWPGQSGLTAAQRLAPHPAPWLKALAWLPSIVSGGPSSRLHLQARWIAVGSFQPLTLLFFSLPGTPFPLFLLPLPHHVGCRRAVAASGTPWSGRDAFPLAPTGSALTSPARQHPLSLDPSHVSGEVPGTRWTLKDLLIEWVGKRTLIPFLP